LERKSEKIVKPEAMMVITLDEIAGRLADLSELQTKILKHMEETTPAGIDIPLPEKTVTDIATVDLIKDYPYRALRSVDFFNKGPNTAYFRINNEAKEIPIEDREQITVSRPRATIEYITLRVDPDEPTTVKLLGHY
jgi:hypothetical protein